MPPLPPVTKALMLICTALYCIDQLLGGTLPVFQWMVLWPVNSSQFWPWQLVTYSLVHANFVHLIFSLLGLWMFGAELEMRWGRQRYLQMLAASVLAAGISQAGLGWLLGSALPAFGSSGAIYGLLLAFALEFPRRQFDLVGFLPMVLMMIPGQIFYTLGIILYVMLLTNRQMVPLRPFPIPSMGMVLIFGGLMLFQGLFYSGSGISNIALLGGMMGAWLMMRFWRGQPPFPPRRRSW
jgi:membrane associated rhomboid family serine protease